MPLLIVIHIKELLKGIDSCYSPPEKCTWNFTEAGKPRVPASPTAAFQAFYTVLAQVTQWDFTQRLLHSASGSIKHFKEDINNTVLIEAITIVLM